MRLRAAAFVPLLAATSLAQAQPAPMAAVAIPQAMGIDYKIVAVKMPRAATPAQEEKEFFPDAFNHSLWIGRGADLVLIHPNGTETILVDASDVFGPNMHPNASCTDPSVSYDGGTVWFSWFEDPQDWNTQRDLPKKPAYIMKVVVATGVVTQVTSTPTIAYADTANGINPQYSRFDVSPTPLPDGSVLYLSNQEGVMDAVTKFPAMRFFRMNADGTNNRVIENFTQGACQHQIVLEDGRIVWTHFHCAGRRTYGTGNYPLMIAEPDMKDWKTFSGVHYKDTAWHFSTQLSTGDVVTTVYYHANNFGHGTLLRIPLSTLGQVQHFGPVSANTSLTYTVYGWPGHIQPQYTGGNDHFPRLEEKVVTPWNLAGSLSKDDVAPNLAGTNTPAGKLTMPAGIPDGHLLCIYSPGGVNGRYPTWEPPHMKVAYIPNGLAPNFSDMTIVKEDANAHYMYPKPIVRYSRMFGQSKPDILPDLANDGSSLTELPAGTPFATIGTSSVYNRESKWPAAYADSQGPDPWDVNVTNNYKYFNAIFHVGQDRMPFTNDRIHAAQVVADMSHFDNRYAGSLSPRFKTHNNGSQVWGILGEIPLRKTDGSGATIYDSQGNPDTSYEVRVPGDVPMHNRLIDADGITLTEEATWHAPRPGERKNNCGGCHAHSLNVTPLDFNTTWAATHPTTDFALQTPLVSQSGGVPTVVNHPTKIKIVEFFRDVRPILDAKCISCHDSSGAPAGNLDLQVDGTAPNFTDNVWDRLAYAGPNPLPPGLNPTWKHHQQTRWVRKCDAGQSLFVWKAYNKRLDSRTDAQRNNDVDFGAAHATALTFDEMRILAMWVDLGCLVDLDPTGTHVWDCFDDQMRPTLTTQGIDWNTATWPLGVLNIGMFDMNSGIKPNSLVVTATNQGGGTVPLTVPGVGVDGGVVQVSLAPLTAGMRWRIDISVEDNFVGTSGHGNISRLSYRVNL